MSKLKAKLFRDFIGGSWLARITKNGEFQREIVFNWPAPFGQFSPLGTDTGLVVPANGGPLDDTKQVAVGGWRSDIGRWNTVWHNEFGGYGEIQWTSQDVVNGITVIYGVAHECKQETDDITNHIIMCEIFDKDNFTYTIRSFRKGITEIVARRIKTAKELDMELKKQAGKLKDEKI
jgi:hypothetical protein